MTLIAATLNVNNHRSLSAQKADIREAIDHTDADVVLVQELTGRLTLRGYDIIQASRRDGSWAGEAIAVDRGLMARNGFARLAVDGRDSVHGSPIRDRTAPRVWVADPGGEWVKFICFHAPPRDYPAKVRSTARAALLAETRVHRWVAGGDFNNRLPEAHIAGVHVAGERIDLIFASHDLAPLCRPGRTLRFPDRDDDHPAVSVIINTTKEHR